MWQKRIFKITLRTFIMVVAVVGQVFEVLVEDKTARRMW